MSSRFLKRWNSISTHRTSPILSERREDCEMLCLPEQPRHTDPAASACFRRTKAPCSLIRPIRSPKIRTAALSIALKALFAARQKTPGAPWARVSSRQGSGADVNSCSNCPPANTLPLWRGSCPKCGKKPHASAPHHGRTQRRPVEHPCRAKKPRHFTRYRNQTGERRTFQSRLL